MPTLFPDPIATDISLENEINFLHTAEKLKMEMRHSWLSNNRQESVAEHSWRLALMVYRYAAKLDKPLNTEKCLKLALIHDLPEAKAGDIPVFQCQSTLQKANKYQLEQAAMFDITSALNDTQALEMYQLWLEYEQQTSYESQVIKALDKIEAFLQHNEAPLATWEEREKRMLFQEKWLLQHCQFDSYLTGLAQLIIKQGIEKLLTAGDDINKIKQEAAAEALT